MPTIPTGSANKSDEFVDALAANEHGGVEAGEEEGVEEETKE